MCGRYAFFSPAEAVRRAFAVEAVPALEPRYNIAPTQGVPAVREGPDGKRSVALLHWGLVPSWAKDRAVGSRMINARSETLAERPAFRRAYRSRRCILPADGWYEWQPGPSGKQPWFICAQDRGLLGLAGLWESWRADDGGTLESCTIITTDASASVAHIHHRMPVVLPTEAFGPWLDTGKQDPRDLDRWLGPCDPALLRAYPVSRRVNNPRHEGPGLVEPAAAG